MIRKTTALAMQEKYQTSAQAKKAFQDLNHYWQDLALPLFCTASHPRVNRMVNIWNQYQCMVTFNMSRSASYYESGIGRGMGFRDSCQDLLGFVHLIPESCKRENH